MLLTTSLELHAPSSSEMALVSFEGYGTYTESPMASLAFKGDGTAFMFGGYFEAVLDSMEKNLYPYPWRTIVYGKLHFYRPHLNIHLKVAKLEHPS